MAMRRFAQRGIGKKEANKVRVASWGVSFPFCAPCSVDHRAQVMRFVAIVCHLSCTYIQVGTRTQRILIRHVLHLKPPTLFAYFHPWYLYMGLQEVHAVSFYCCY